MENKFLSLDWFKSKVEVSIDRVIANKLDSLMEQDIPLDQQPVAKHQRQFFSMKMVNDTLTVVLNDGSILSKPNACEDHFHAVANATSVEEILAIMSSAEVMADVNKAKAEAAKMKALQKGIQSLGDLPDFEVEGQSVYLAGTSRSMPQLLVEKFIEIVDRVGQQPADHSKTFNQALNEDDDYMAHKNFFMWCCLNPRAEVANELYRFLTENSFKITKQGFFVALRNVVTLHGSPELVHFVSNAYNKVKAVWKKNPDHYTVFLEDGEYKLVHDSALVTIRKVTSDDCPECNGAGGWYNEDCEEYSEYSEDDSDECWEDCENCDGTGIVEEYTYTEEVPVNHGQKIGGLTELYLDLPNREENRFTDNWTKTFDIRVGQVVSMPMEECNWSTQDCATAGLHFAGYTAPYVLCGDTTVMTLHNPMKVVGIGAVKGRCWEYLPFMLTTVAEADQIMNDRSFDFLQLDEEYAIRELESLTEKVKEGFSVEAKKYEFNLPQISASEINMIVSNLSEMKTKIKDRVVTIK
jgi:hypothetical protein